MAKDENKEKEESELEDIIEDSEEKPKEEKISEKENAKKPKDIIPEFSESRTRNFLNFLNRNSSVTLDRRGSPFSQISKDLELSLEDENITPTLQRSNQNRNSENENPFEYIPKNEQNSSGQQGVYQHYENTSGIKMQKAEKVAESWSKPFQERKVNPIQSERQTPTGQNYDVYIKPSDPNDKEKEFSPNNPKMEYYSHK